jgi:hypothetical protein
MAPRKMILRAAVSCVLILAAHCAYAAHLVNVDFLHRT